MCKGIGYWQKLTDDKMICWLDDDCESWEITELDENLIGKLHDDFKK